MVTNNKKSPKAWKMRIYKLDRRVNIDFVSSSGVTNAVKIPARYFADMFDDETKHKQNNEII